MSAAGPLKTAEVLTRIFGDDLHALRIRSLANGVIGVLHAATLAVTAIGKAYSAAIGGDPKHGVKQVDRLVGNSGIAMADVLPSWMRFVVGARKQIVLAMDWTDFDDDGHTTLAINMVTSHGRATPLAWMTVEKAGLKGKRNGYEYELIEQVHRALPETVKITVQADRGFGDHKLYELLAILGWDYVIRFRGSIVVEDEHGDSRPARDRVPTNGRAVMLRKVRVTRHRCEIPAVVFVHDKRMKEPWFLATSRADLEARAVVKLYGRRFTIEETFRDHKDPRFGMGLLHARVSSTDRRDRLLLLAAIAHALLTLLGAVGERLGLDRHLKANTVKTRTLSLFNQGLHWYRALPNMKQERFELLMPAYDRAIREHEIFNRVFGLI
jgi:Transposase DDE domain